MNLEFLTDLTQPADGLVVVCQDSGVSLVVVIVPPFVRARSLRSFVLALEDLADNDLFPPVKIESGQRPGSSHYLAWRTTPTAVRAEVLLLLEYMRQTRVMRNPIVSELEQ